MVIYPIEEIRVKLMIPYTTNKKVVENVKKNIRQSRKENKIHLWITHMYIENNTVFVEMEGERIKKIPSLFSNPNGLPKWYPKKFTVFATMTKDDKLADVIDRKRQFIKNMCGESYDVRLVGFNVEKGKNKILIALLAEMQSWTDMVL